MKRSAGAVSSKMTKPGEGFAGLRRVVAFREGGMSAVAVASSSRFKLPRQASASGPLSYSHRSIQHQKLKLSILLSSNVVGGPSLTSPSLPTVRLPSLPASNESPSLPVIVPDARLAAAYAAR